LEELEKPLQRKNELGKIRNQKDKTLDQNIERSKVFTASLSFL
jgi:hypothetical protein